MSLWVDCVDFDAVVVCVWKLQAVSARDIIVKLCIVEWRSSSCSEILAWLSRKA